MMMMMATSGSSTSPPSPPCSSKKCKEFDKCVPALRYTALEGALRVVRSALTHLSHLRWFSVALACLIALILVCCLCSCLVDAITKKMREKQTAKEIGDVEMVRPEDVYQIC